jgi:hypothetical protein
MRHNMKKPKKRRKEKRRLLVRKNRRCLMIAIATSTYLIVTLQKLFPKKIRINSSLIKSCRMLEMPDPNGGQIELAAIILEKRKK